MRLVASLPFRTWVIYVYSPERSKHSSERLSHTQISTKVRRHLRCLCEPLVPSLWKKSLPTPVSSLYPPSRGFPVIPLASYYPWRGTTCLDRHHRHVLLPAEETACRSYNGKEKVYDHAHEGGAVANIFEEFCRKILCMASWNFIMSSVSNKIQGCLSAHEPLDTKAGHKLATLRAFMYPDTVQPNGICILVGVRGVDIAKTTRTVTTYNTWHYLRGHRD